MKQLLVMAGLVVAGSVAQANLFDAQIKIDRAVGSPTITIHYTGAHAKTVEMLLNGQSVATRSLDADADAGDTNFRIDTLGLLDGDNKIVIRLLDASGTIVAEKSAIVTEGDSAPSPFFISVPKVGQSVQGPVQISVGMTENFANAYVSFFIDNQLKTMTNTPPFAYVWDTTREANGWHQLQSWLVDDDNTYKSKVVRVFVNNPGGQTQRIVIEKPTKGTTAQKPASINLKPKYNSLTTPNLKGEGTHAVKYNALGVGSKGLYALAPKTHAHGLNLLPIKSNPYAAIRGQKAGLKPTPIAKPATAGAKHLALTGHRMVGYPANALALHQGGIARAAMKATKVVEIVKGARLQNVRTFSVLIDGAVVDFDVQPRVDHGIPMTPIRYLLEKDGGKVHWTSLSKTVNASDRGFGIQLQIGNNIATVDNKPMTLESAPYISGSRTIVPLSFIRDALRVDVQYDKATGHVLITSLDHK